MANKTSARIQRGHNGLRAVTVLMLLSLLGGCASMVERAGQRFADNLGRGLSNHDDPATVAAALPAYLVLLDGLIEGDPESAPMLLAGAKLYGAYGGTFVDDPARAQRLVSRARHYAWRASCLRARKLCEAAEGPFERFEAVIAGMGSRDLDLIYGYAVAWAGWIQVNKADWNAVAEIPRVELMLKRVVELDPEHDKGMPQLYLGVLATLLPPAFGGKPEQGRAYFEQALELTERRNHMVHVLYAENYSRLVFDQALHEQLIEEVLGAQSRAPGYTLFNVLAQDKARALKASAVDYF